MSIKAHRHKSNRNNPTLDEFHIPDKAVGAAAERTKRRNVFTGHLEQVTVEIVAHVLPAVRENSGDIGLARATFWSHEEESSRAAAATAAAEGLSNGNESASWKLEV